jgi:hypothetical protein
MKDLITLPAPDLFEDASDAAWQNQLFSPLRTFRSNVAHAAWEAECRAFLRLLPTLLATRRHQYVAVLERRVIADGPDQIEVAKRAYAQVGYVPIYVGLVTDESPQVLRFPSPRMLPKEGG